MEACICAGKAWRFPGGRVPDGGVVAPETFADSGVLIINAMFTFRVFPSVTGTGSRTSLRNPTSEASSL
jgi:hypothetical protein